jgi:hypothetical protein
MPPNLSPLVNLETMRYLLLAATLFAVVVVGAETPGIPLMPRKSSVQKRSMGLNSLGWEPIIAGLDAYNFAAHFAVPGNGTPGTLEKRQECPADMTQCAGSDRYCSRTGFFCCPTKPDRSCPQGTTCCEDWNGCAKDGYICCPSTSIDVAVSVSVSVSKQVVGAGSDVHSFECHVPH